MSVIPHSEVCDLAKLTLLVYEYGKSFTLDKNKTIEDFVMEINDTNKSPIENEFRLNIIKDLAKSSPHGKVYKFYSIDSTDLQVGITISETHKRISVIFRGSESKYDWYYDLSILKKNIHDDVYVHSGFYNQLHSENTYENLLSDLKTLTDKNPDYSIYITGHSLGAALSTLFGYELSREVKNVITVVSFASPRVGDYEFRKKFDEKENLIHYRVSNNRDVVTSAPMFYYQHVGTNIALTEDSYQFYYNYSYNGWYHFSLFTCWSISDHYMDLYYKRLVKNVW